MRSIDDLQDAFLALEADSPNADEVLAALHSANATRSPRGVRAWGVPIAVAWVAAAAITAPVVFLHSYRHSGQSASPATVAPPVVGGTEFPEPLPAPAGRSGLSYGFTIGPIAGCTSSVGAITPRYQEERVFCGAAGPASSVFLFYKGAFSDVLGPTAPVAVSGLPSGYSATLQSPEDGSRVAALVWKYAPDAWAVVTRAADNGAERAQCLDHAQQAAAQQAAAARGGTSTESKAAAAAAAAARRPNCVPLNVPAKTIAQAVRPAKIPATVPLRLDLPGLHIHDVVYHAEPGSSPYGSVGFSARPETTASKLQSGGDAWNIMYGLGAGGPFPTVDTSGRITRFDSETGGWTVYHDKKGHVTVFVLSDPGQFGLVVTPGNGRSVSDADVEAVAAKITLASKPSATATWFDASTVLP